LSAGSPDVVEHIAYAALVGEDSLAGFATDEGPYLGNSTAAVDEVTCCKPYPRCC
jgi:hypothetical protein